MATIDDKVVAMSFENSRFEANANRTLSTLDRLKKSLNFSGAGKGLDQISASAGRVNLSHIANGVDSIRSKLGMLNVAAMAIFANIAMQAAAAGARLIKSFTIDPIMQGYREYETKMGSIQTILANTAAAGTTLKEVNSALAELNKYADQTIYNFSEMTRNIGTFTAAGVDLKTSVNAIKGIANLAALSGSNAEQASTAMYQLSQAISAGRVSLQDWLSVEHAGMAGAIFQRSLAETAVHMGTLDKSALTLSGSMKTVTINGESFRRSISAKPGKDSWLTGKVLVETLSKLSGNYTDAQLKAKGYTDAQIKAIQAQAKSALGAATNVKTLSQLISTTKEAIGSGWANTFEIIFGNFGQAKKLFTSVSNSIGAMVLKSSNARNKLLKDWAALGGRTLLLDSFKRMFENLGQVLAPIRGAFRDIFPKNTASDLMSMTQSFSRFVDTLKPAPATLIDLHRTFEGLFAAFDIVKRVIGGVIGVFGDLFGAIGVGSGGFLDFTGDIGDFIVKIDDAIKSGDGFKNFFATLGSVLSKPVAFLRQVGHAIANLFTGFNVGALGGLGGALTPMEAAIHGISTAWDAFIQKLGNVQSVVQPLMQGLGDAFSSIGSFIQNAVQNINWNTVLGTAAVGIGGGFLLLFRKIFKGFNVQEFGGGLIDALTSPLKALTGNLTAMQNQVRAKTLLEIAGAVGILAASILALSTINSKDLDKSLSGLGIAFAELLGAMKIVSLIGKGGGFIAMPIIAGSMIILATAIGILTLSVKSLSKLDWNSLVKGLTGVGTLLAGIAIASGPLSKNASGMIASSLAMIAIGVAMKILASAVKSFGQLSLETLAKGLISVAAALTTIALTTQLMPPSMPAIGLGLVVIGAGLKIVASAIGQLGKLNVATLAKGILSTGVALLVLAGAMRLMPPGMAVQAAGLVIVALALQGISRAVVKMGALSFEKIAHGLTALGGALAILAIGLTAMSGTLAGAAALTVASAGMMLLAPALKIMGSMSWGDIAKGMLVLAGAMAILGIAGLALGPVAPSILALGVALMAIGAALALAGVGIAAVGFGLSAIAVAGPKAVEILSRALTEFISKVPQAAVKFGQGLVALVVEVGKAAPKLVQAFAKILDALLNAIIIETPKLAKALEVLLVQLMGVIRRHFPELVRLGFQMVMNLLNGIKNNIGRIVTVAADIIVRFLNALAKKLPDIITAGANIVVKFLEGLARNADRVVTAGANFVIKFLEGLGKNVSGIIGAAAGLVFSLIMALSKQIVKLVDVGFQAIIYIVNGLAKGITGNMGGIIGAAENLATAFAGAIGKALGAAPRLIVNTAGSFFSGLWDGLTNAVKKNPPNMVPVGSAVMTAFVKGATNSGEIAKAQAQIGFALQRMIIATTQALGGLAIPAGATGHIFSGIIRAAVASIAGGTPAVMGAGVRLAQGLATAIGSASGKVSNAAGIVMAKFAGTISARQGDVTAHGAGVMVAFIRTISSGTSKMQSSGNSLMTSFLRGITSNIPKIVSSGQQIVTSLARGIEGSASKLITSGTTAVGRFLQGIMSSLSRITATGGAMIAALMAGLGGSMSAINAMGITAAGTFIGGVQSGLSGLGSIGYGAGEGVGASIVSGMMVGAANMGPAFSSVLINVVSTAVNAAKASQGIHSPSTVMIEMGKNMVEGLAIGLVANASTATDAAEYVVNAVIAKTKHHKKNKWAKEFSGSFFRSIFLGLRGIVPTVSQTMSTITQTLSTLRQKVNTDIGRIKQRLDTENQRLGQLEKKKKLTKKESAEMDKLKGKIKKDIKDLKTLNAAMDAIDGSWALRHLKNWTKTFDKWSEILAKRKQLLADAKQERADAAKAYTEQYSALPELVTNRATQLPRYLTSLRRQVADTKKYRATLEKLRTLGLDDATYKKLLSEGIVDQSFAEQLLAGGKTAINALTALDKQLAKESKGIGDEASSNLYDTGVQAVQDLVWGAQRMVANASGKMKHFAGLIIESFRKAFGLKYRKYSMYSFMHTFVQGIESDTPKATSAVTQLATKLNRTLQQTINTEPKITPILDLSQIKKGSQQLNRMLNVVPISAAASYRQASSIKIPGTHTGEEVSNPAGTSIKFEQNNYSPEALTPIQIYRQTKNQLSMAKSALGR